MDLKLGLKLTRVMDEFTTADLQISKDSAAGTVFVSKETQNMYILTAHLKGYRKDNIKIEINEDGSCITISGEKPVQEMIMVGYQVHKKGIEIKRFCKSFKIPHGVILDEINARFNEDESGLTITMPKMVHGIRGDGIEEVKEQTNISRQASGTLQIAEDETSRQGKEPEKILREGGEMIDEKSRKGREADAPRTAAGVKDHQKENAQGTKSYQLTEEEAEMKNTTSIQKTPSPNHETSPKRSDKKETKKDIEETRDSECERGDSGQHKPNANGIHGEGDIKEGEVPKEEAERRSMLCTPIVAGSAILVSLVVFVFSFIRQRNQQAKRQD